MTISQETKRAATMLRMKESHIDVGRDTNATIVLAPFAKVICAKEGLLLVKIDDIIPTF